MTILAWVVIAISLMFIVAVTTNKKKIRFVSTDYNDSAVLTIATIKRFISN